ncbi:MAG: type II methionyl aminopeptidase [Candidatus Aenigmarchaeota archaeon]|nr:type II methionyl aminopeptidase [Candidatus Aenigmarchaeota archaeon]MDI6722076.1 type II methionyl aminopeptidase [Candidatus Aenigmarchaeota archaeon]
MESEVLEKYIKAGRIAADVREESKSCVRPGASLLEIAERLEALIREKGGEPAFPVNLSLNDEAAHYTPTLVDERKITESDVVKVDVGVHVDGYIGDTACTIVFDGKHENLVKAAEAALDKAVPLCVPGQLVDEISGVIEDTIKGYGYLPVSNLTGHGLKQWQGHAEPTIHNVRVNYNLRLQEDEVIAIEPFATNGAGMIKDSEPVVIFSLFSRKPVRNPDARKIIQQLEAFSGLPFSERWIKGISPFKIRLAMRELRQANALYEYPVLKEVRKGIVSQAEHTIIVKENPVVTTK